jgi:hypothetical protein
MRVSVSEKRRILETMYNDPNQATIMRYRDMRFETTGSVRSPRERIGRGSNRSEMHEVRIALISVLLVEHHLDVCDGMGFPYCTWWYLYVQLVPFVRKMGHGTLLVVINGWNTFKPVFC